MSETLCPSREATVSAFRGSESSFAFSRLHANKASGKASPPMEVIMVGCLFAMNALAVRGQSPAMLLVVTTKTGTTKTA